jgi:hypothetical protein
MVSSSNTSIGEFLQVAVNREFLKLQERTGISVISRWDGKHFKPEATEMKR